MASNKVVTELVVKGANNVIAALRKQQQVISKSTVNADKGLYAVAGATAAIGVAAVVAGANLMGLFRKVNPEAQILSKQMAMLEHSMKNMPRDAGDVTFADANKQIEKLFDTSTLLRSELYRISAALARTTKDSEVLERASQAVVNLMAAKPEWSADSASQWMTTVLGDPGRTIDKMRRAEIQVTKEFQKQMEYLVEQGKLREAQLLTIDQITKRVSGAAVASMESYGGRWDKVNQQVTDFGIRAAQIFGEGLLPALETFLEEIEGPLGEDFLAAMKELQPLVTSMATSFADIAKSTASIVKDFSDSGIGGWGDEFTGLLRAINPADPFAMRAYDVATGEGEGGGFQDVLMNSILRLLGQNEKVVSEFENITNTLNAEDTASLMAGVSGAVDSLAKAAQAEKDQAAAQAAARLGMSPTEYDIHLREKELAEIREATLAKQLKDAERLRARINTFATGMETPLEQFNRQQGMLVDYATVVRALGADEEKLNFVREQSLRLTQKYMEGLVKPIKDIAARYAAKKNPFLSIQKDFETFVDGMVNLKFSNQKTGLQDMLDAVLAARKGLNPKTSQAFSPVTSGVDSLYSNIRDTLLEKDEPIPAAIAKQTEEQQKFLEDLAKKIEAAIANIGKTPPPAPTKPVPVTTDLSKVPQFQFDPLGLEKLRMGGIREYRPGIRDLPEGMFTPPKLFSDLRQSTEVAPVETENMASRVLKLATGSWAIAMIDAVSDVKKAATKTEPTVPKGDGKRVIEGQTNAIVKAINNMNSALANLNPGMVE